MVRRMNKFKMEVNIAKSKIMIFNKDTDSPVEFRYVGCTTLGINKRKKTNDIYWTLKDTIFGK